MGADWRWDPEQNVVLMGADLQALGEFVVESMQVKRGAAFDSRFPDGFMTVELTLRRRGGTETEDRVLLLSPADASGWAAGFKFSAGW